MTCRIDHLTLTCYDPNQVAARLTDAFGHRLDTDLVLRSAHDTALSVRGLGPYDSRTGIMELVFTVPDLQAMRQHCTDYGLVPIPDPGAGLLYRDPHGLLFRIVDRGVGNGKIATPISPLRLAHVDVLVPDIAVQRAFYGRVLGLITVCEYIADDGAFVYLADRDYRKGSHDFLIEVVGPPNLEPREQKILAEIGPMYDHICYETPDVNIAYRELVATGSIGCIEPYEAYGGILAWVRDLDGLDIELIRPISHTGFSEAVMGGPVVKRG